MPLQIDELNKRLTQIENDSNVEWFKGYPYDADERATYADFLELLLMDLFQACIDNRFTLIFEDFFEVYLEWLNHIAEDIIEDPSEEPIEDLEREFGIDVVEEAKEYAEYSMQSTDTVRFNNFIETHDFDSKDDKSELDELKMLVSASSRAKDMSRTETNIICNYFVHDTAKSLFKYHVWVSEQDDRVRLTHAIADGQIKPIDEPFEVGGSKLLYPCDMSLGAGAGEIINCRCVELFSNTSKNENLREKVETSNTNKGKDVTEEYKSKATPKFGSIEYDNGYDVESHKDEIAVANLLHEIQGGDIRCLNEKDNSLSPDFLWNEKLWDLKTTSTEKSANSAIRHGLQQIRENAGGIILNYENRDIDMNILWEVVQKRMQWKRYESIVDIVIIQNKKIVKVWRY